MIPEPEASEEASGFSTPIGKAPTLVDEVSRRISRDITRGILKPGARLPTEKQLMAALGVSRTVVREAVAQLRANGLVTTRQGLGAFVAEDVLTRPFTIGSSEQSAVNDLINVTELRLAIEVESAALAAERGRADQLDEIRMALAEIDAAIARGEAGVPEDFQFHRLIAVATGNAQFPRMLDHLGQIIIPRKSVGAFQQMRSLYLELIQSEHHAIYEAIARRDGAAASAAMRDHLTGITKRYRALSRSN